MAQLERPQRQIDTSSKTPATIHTMEQLLRVSSAGEASKSKQSPTLSSCSSNSSTHSSSPSSPFFQRLRHHDSEDDHGQSQKKSVLTKVKEKAKKLRHSLSKKKHEDGNLTSPSSATGLEADGAEDEAEYIGAPVYDWEKALVKGNARQHPSPRANPVTPEKHFISTSDKHMVEQGLEKTLNRSLSIKKTTPQPATITITPTTQHATATASTSTTTTQPAKTAITPNATTDTTTVINTNTNNNTNTNANADTFSGPRNTMTETVERKLTPVHIEAPDEAQSITSKVQNLVVSNSKPTEHHHDHTASSSAAAAAVTPKATHNTSLSYAAPRTAPAKALSQGSSTPLRSFAPSPPVTPIAPEPTKVPSHVSSTSPRTFASSPPATHTAPASVTTPPSAKNTSPTAQIWDKGVSVKEYLMTKLEPGEDEKALSQVISEAMSPRRTPGDAGVMEKVREAVTSLLRTEGSPKYTDTSNPNTPTSATTTPCMSSQFPASTTPNTTPRSSSQMPASSTNASRAASQMPASSTNAIRASSQMPASSTSVYRTSSQIPVSSNAQPSDYEVAQEENHGRILQAN